MTKWWVNFNFCLNSSCITDGEGVKIRSQTRTGTFYMTTANEKCACKDVGRAEQYGKFAVCARFGLNYGEFSRFNITNTIKYRLCNSRSTLLNASDNFRVVKGGEGPGGKCLEIPRRTAGNCLFNTPRKPGYVHIVHNTQ